MAIYCWSVWRPTGLPYVTVFLIGMLEDLLRGLPLGLTPLLLLILQAVIRAQHRHLNGRTFDIFWLGFVLGPRSTQSCSGWRPWRFPAGYVGPEPGLFQLMFSVAIFPIVVWLLLRAGRVFRLAV